jgi:hypothetical protein
MEEALLILLIIVLLSPLIYIYYFLIIELPKRFGYWKFSLIVLCYLMIIGINTYLLSIGFLGSLVFFLVPIAIQIIGAYYFRNEIIKDLRRAWQQLKS